MQYVLSVKMLTCLSASLFDWINTCSGLSTPLFRCCLMLLLLIFFFFKFSCFIVMLLAGPHTFLLSGSRCERGCLSSCLLTHLKLCCSVSVLHAPAYQALTFFSATLFLSFPFLHSLPHAVIFFLQMAAVIASSSRSDKYILC